jgi:hypothetical protein
MHRGPNVDTISTATQRESTPKNSPDALTLLASRSVSDTAIAAILAAATAENAAGILSDERLQAIYEAAHASRKNRADTTARYAATVERALAAPRAPKKTTPESIKRRRQHAMSGAVPKDLAADFTQGEIAVLTVIARQWQHTKKCGLAVSAIAAIAGTCETLVHTALQKAKALGMVDVLERRLSYCRSLTNIVSLISKRWAEWLKIDPLTIGCGKLHPTGSLRLALWALARAKAVRTQVRPLEAPS